MYCRKSIAPCYCKSCSNIVDQSTARDSSMVILRNGEFKEISDTECYLTNQSITLIYINTISFLSITTLDISNNPINFLPELHTLRKLICSNCNLTKLPPNLPRLEELDCSNNGITVIPQYKSLAVLNCSHNIIYNLDANRPKRLICNNNPITSINIPTITYLEAYGCPLLVLHKIPSLRRKSSMLDKGKFRWVISRAECVDKTNILIDWNTLVVSPIISSYCAKSKFWATLCKFSFTNLKY